MPETSKYLIASGSAITDKNNIAGKGKNAILAAYTDLQTEQYHGRPAITYGSAQMLMYSTDNGMTFKYFEKNPIIPVPDGQSWRDPKILYIDDKTLCIAVYEIFEEQHCISFYTSTDCETWEFCSRILNFCECPDLFCLKARNIDDELWILYGGNGKYKIGNFENFEFIPNGDEGYLDYGIYS